MPVSAETLRLLMAAGLKDAALLEVVDSIEADNKAKPRSSGAARQARYRANQKAKSVTGDVTSDASQSVTSVTVPRTRVEDNLLPKKISGQEENKNISPEPDKSAPVVVIGLPTVSEGDFPVSQADIDGWAEAFPGVDVRQQLAAMRQWLLANSTRRKTRRGMRKFVVSWLDRRQNAAPPPAQRATAPPQRSIDDALNDIVNGKSHVPFTGPTIDASVNRPDWRSAENLVPFNALSAGRRPG